MKFTKLESDLFKLAMLEGKFYKVFTELPKIPEKSERFPFQSVIREYAIIQLNNFIEIRDSLVRQIKKEKKEIVDYSLAPFWEPIINHKKVIKKLRDRYLAHIQEKTDPFKETIEEIVYRAKFPDHWNDITYYSGCGWNYSRYMRLNFYEEFKTAMSKYYQSMSSPRVLFRSSGVKNIQNVSEELDRTNKEVIENLRNNKLKLNLTDLKKPIKFSFKRGKSVISYTFEYSY